MEKFARGGLLKLKPAHMIKWLIFSAHFRIKALNTTSNFFIAKKAGTKPSIKKKTSGSLPSGKYPLVF
ncbi:hypothetical protein [uncultured Phascolarctobacterium sp.]|uniref:hypothetical protein n=1 Tax=uncultured Phascolarctobacterium sp. TaxID=512296 RepID=UPI0025E439BC|nr:hypothetical protein [uncultured Phascolarctobacterium sp.]